MTLGELFKQAGYITLFSGKHHSTERPTTRGFDHYSGLLDGASNHFNPGPRREGEGKPAQKRPNRKWVIDGELFQPYAPEKGFFTTDAFTDYALDWLEGYRDDERPVFLYLSYTAPHDPLMAWPEDIAKYRGAYNAGYRAIREERFARQKAIGLLNDDHPLSEASYDPWSELSEAEQQEKARKMEVYAAMIDSLDQNIGRLLARLEALGMRENTLILFASDNGASSRVVDIRHGDSAIGSIGYWSSQGRNWANVSNTPLRFYKNWSHEGGIKTPLIAHWPEGISGTDRIETTPVHFIDFLPTFAEILEVDFPKQFKGEALTPLDGISFLPLFAGRAIERAEPLFWQWAHGKAIRQGDWKAVAHKDEWALYNLDKDPVEAHDLAELHPDKLKRLIATYKQWESSSEP